MLMLYTVSDYTVYRLYRSSCANIPMRPKMSRMEGTKITRRLTTKIRQHAMVMCTNQLKGLAGNKIWSKALRIYRGKEGRNEGKSEKCWFMVLFYHHRKH